MDPELKIKLRKYYSEEKIRVMELLEQLTFKPTSVEPRILKNITLNDFKDGDFEIDWMPIDRYLMVKDVINIMEIEGKVPVGPIRFIGALSKIDKITGVRICLFPFENKGWVHLVATEDIQRTICSILSGDGFGPKCLFAVKPKGA